MTGIIFTILKRNIKNIETHLNMIKVSNNKLFYINFSEEEDLIKCANVIVLM